MSKVEFVFTHKGVEYLYKNGWIYNEKGWVLCMCDISETSYAGNETVLRVCAEVALQARADGFTQGYNKRTDQMKRFLGV